MQMKTTGKAFLPGFKKPFSIYHIRQGSTIFTNKEFTVHEYWLNGKLHRSVKPSSEVGEIIKKWQRKEDDDNAIALHCPFIGNKKGAMEGNPQRLSLSSKTQLKLFNSSILEQN